MVIEATDHIGGRCVTDMKSFGVPFDRGAHWIYLPDSNPVTKLTPVRGIDIYPAPQSQKVRIGLRYAREGELEDFLTAQVRATRAIDEVARKADIPCEQAMPPDLGDWRATDRIHARPVHLRQGFAAGVVVRLCARRASAMLRPSARKDSARWSPRSVKASIFSLATPATVVDTRSGITVETAKGAINARAAIVTVPTNVVSSGGLKFSPELGHHQIDAFGRMSLGSYDHIALELRGNPLGLESDDLVLQKSTDTHTAAMLANVSGTELCLIDVAGAFGRDLSAQGEAAMIDFAVNWLAGLYGSEVKSAIGRKHATRWNADPYALGAWSAAVPGSQFARRQLLEPIADNVWYAGEAAHETLWGTVGGAWESGERAADAVLHQIGPARAAAPVEAEAKPKHKPVHVRAERRAPREESEPQYYGGTPSIIAPER